MRNTILTMFTAMLLPIAASAQFYTITKETEVQLPPVMNSTISADNKGETSVNCTETIGKDTVTVPKDGQVVNAPKARKGDKRMSLKVTTGKSEKVNPATPDAGLPELTIPNLYKEIVNNGIRHPKNSIGTGHFRNGVVPFKSLSQPEQSFWLDQSTDRTILRVWALDGKCTCLLYEGTVPV